MSKRRGTTKVEWVSPNEYQRLLRRDREVLLVRDLDDATLDAIRNAVPSEESRRLGHLMDDPETD